MIGSHLSIAGGMALALREAKTLGLDCVQVFTKNQQQWKAPPLKPDAVAAWRADLAELAASAWAPGNAAPESHQAAPAPRTVSHASYLINMASPDAALRDASIALMRDELDRCEQLAIPLLVFHPGAFTSGTAETGLANIADACSRLIDERPDRSVTLCLENVAGAGSTLGRTFEELADLRGRIAAKTGRPDRIGFCLDTCHAHAAGYDLSDAQAAARALSDADRVIGLQNIRVIHANDSKGAAGSRLDRHEHIGRGTIGLAGFAAVVGHDRLGRLPIIMETPKVDAPGQAGGAPMPMDRVNAAILRALAAGGIAEGRATMAALPAPPAAAPPAKPKARPPAGTKPPRGKPAPAPRRTTSSKQGNAAKPAGTSRNPKPKPTSKRKSKPASLPPARTASARKPPTRKPAKPR